MSRPCQGHVDGFTRPCPEPATWVGVVVADCGVTGVAHMCGGHWAALDGGASRDGRGHRVRLSFAAPLPASSDAEVPS